MVNTCVVVNCNSGYTRRENQVDFVPEKVSVFHFPVKKSELNKKWIRFVNRKNWTPPRHSGIFAKHFEEKFLKIGKRLTLRWNLDPVPTIFSKPESVYHFRFYLHPQHQENLLLESQRYQIKLKTSKIWIKL